MSRITVVVNPTSGRGRAARVLPEVEGRLATMGAELLVSTAPEDAAKLTRGAAEAGAGVVVAMGGDGMVGMVGTALLGTDAALGIIPTGTGNDFAVALGYARRRPVEALSYLEDPELLRIDAGLVRWAGGERHFLNVAGTGFDSEVTETANRMRTLRDRLGGLRTRSARDRVRKWRMHYFVDIARLEQIATIIQMRCGERIAAGKRRELGLLLDGERSPTTQPGP